MNSIQLINTCNRKILTIHKYRPAYLLQSMYCSRVYYTCLHINYCHFCLVYSSRFRYLVAGKSNADKLMLIHNNSEYPHFIAFHYAINQSRRCCLYLLTPWCRVLLEKLNGLQIVKRFSAFHGTQRFITALTSVHHLSLSWACPIQSIHPHPTSWRSILILPTYLRLGLSSGLFLSGFPTKTLYTPLSLPRHLTCKI